MKKAKYIMLVFLLLLLVLALVMGFVVFNHAKDLLISPPQTTPSSSVTTPTTLPNTSTTPVHHCDYSIKAETFAPGCEMLGYTVYACECGRTEYRDYLDPLGHTYGEYITVEPTCTEDGWTQRTCSRCYNVERTQPTPAVHKFGEPEETRNYQKLTCSDCGFIKQYSTESGPVWMMEISAPEKAEAFTYLHIFLDLNGGMMEYAYDIYVSLEDLALSFDYLNGCLIVSYPAGNETVQCELAAEETALTILPDGSFVKGAPALN